MNCGRKKGCIPWNKGLHWSEDIIEKIKHNLPDQSGINNPNYGNHLSDESKDKIRVAKKGQIPWNKGLKNCYSKETLKIMSDAKKHKHLSPQHKEHISESGKGKIPWNKGKHVSYMSGDLNPSKKQEVRSKISKSRKEYFINYPEAREKIRLRRLGKHASYETKQLWSKQRSGKNHPNYIDGRSFLPYCEKFNKKFKIDVIKRDKYTCQLCGSIWKEKNILFSVHHIHYDKQNCYPDCICLCAKCNSKVNFNRDYYESLFMNNLNDRELLFWTKYRDDNINSIYK